MVERQKALASGAGFVECQGFDFHRLPAAAHIAGWALWQRQAADTVLDADLPGGERAQVDPVGAVSARGPCRLRELRIVGSQPEERAGVDRRFTRSCRPRRQRERHPAADRRTPVESSTHGPSPLAAERKAALPEGVSPRSGDCGGREGSSPPAPRAPDTLRGVSSRRKCSGASWSGSRPEKRPGSQECVGRQGPYSSRPTHQFRVPGRNAVTPEGPTTTPRIRLLKPHVVL